jgi:ribonuclease HI
LEIWKQTRRGEDSDKKQEVDRFFPQFWTLYFDGSKSQEGFGVGCILINPKGKRKLLSCRFEFECTNNIVEYEAIVQGLNKSMDLNVK